MDRYRNFQTYAAAIDGINSSVPDSALETGHCDELPDPLHHPGRNLGIDGAPTGMRTYSARKFNDVHAELTEIFPIFAVHHRQLSHTLSLCRTEFVRLPNQAFRWNIQATMQLPDHLQGQRTLMVKDFVNPIQAADHRL